MTVDLLKNVNNSYFNHQAAFCVYPFQSQRQNLPYQNICERFVLFSFVLLLLFGMNDFDIAIRWSIPYARWNKQQ